MMGSPGSLAKYRLRGKKRGRTKRRQSAISKPVDEAETQDRSLRPGSTHSDDPGQGSHRRTCSEHDEDIEKITQQKEISEALTRLARGDLEEYWKVMTNLCALIKLAWREAPFLISSMKKAVGCDNAALITFIQKGPHTDIIPQNSLPWQCVQSESGSPGRRSPSPPSPLSRSADSPPEVVQQQDSGDTELNSPPIQTSLTPTQQRSQPTQQIAHVGSEWTAPSTIAGGTNLDQKSAQHQQEQDPSVQPAHMNGTVPDSLPSTQVGWTTAGVVHSQAPILSVPPARPYSLVSAAPQSHQASWTTDANPQKLSAPSHPAPGAAPGSFLNHVINHGVQAGMSHPSPAHSYHPGYPHTHVYGSLQPHYTIHTPSTTAYTDANGPSQHISQLTNAQTGPALPNIAVPPTASQPGPQWMAHAGGFPQASTHFPRAQQVDSAFPAHPSGQLQGTFVQPGQLQTSSQSFAGQVSMELPRQPQWPTQPQGGGSMTETDLYGLGIIGPTDHPF
ncbi:uncharacterized protein KD926_007474 [Aspergillus affinis]|uniref:uncharacterized protein n=1 Tax=Aspergillus affinis TaxID=1070780 RepID=UPI0022FE0D9D|nr:uncharacterized protein KD926_007474 [Aspergillus affinis]KAI9041057.1 hypothetical protein KD926_007474 [Aspergillus affinis]